MPVKSVAAPRIAVHHDTELSVALICNSDILSRRVHEILRENDIECAIEVGSVVQLGSGIPGFPIDAVVLSINATRTQCLETFKAARSRFPDTPIVGLWPGFHRGEDRRAMRTGIDGLLQEDQIETALVPTLQAVCAGLVCFPRSIPVNVDAHQLSSREKQILGMLIIGFTNGEIASRLYLAESTVKSHLSSAYAKLGVRSRKDAAAMILDPEAGLGTGILAISG